ncbi:acyl-CoA desaturase [Gloeobacter violaceus]|uniref:Delta 9 acyl-lipid desaturase n=1 Tax=Gloeobacter violaceus (strain ATCC 29082 / PCC 7421) TaxID=251221 RepID=Q7NCW0_GLOVI|nr:fatty acid desaturase [Gloeobacter violaceus]BAC90807.1 delta 9 acyl-lipid desaturase [Gloeobacter violaceus PCC 7421]
MTANVVSGAGGVAGWRALNWPTLGFLVLMHGLALLAPWFFNWQALAVALGLHWLIGSLGICLGYHRLLTHRSFRVPRGLECVFAMLGALALQGGPIFWVAAHRLHHAHADDDARDPHSSGRGFWWSHVLWLLYRHPELSDGQTHRKYAPDLARQPFYRWLNRYHLLLQIPLAVLLFALGGWPFVVYGVFVRAVVLWHTTWLINSAAHLAGYRTSEVPDSSRNLWWAALLTYGEGWHNNHHAQPNAARAGLRWWEVDMTWWVIRALEMAGLATQVVPPRPNPVR